MFGDVLLEDVRRMKLTCSGQELSLEMISWTRLWSTGPDLLTQPTLSLNYLLATQTKGVENFVNNVN